ncbi:MAG: DNA helicase PcrA [Coriobacteriia bacterium]
MLEHLNEAQRLAVTTTEGPLLVLAGAGSGKTRVLTHRIAHLVRDRGVPPSAILAITFTNKAANEMKDRISTLVGPVAHGMWVMTFHAMCVRILRAHAEALGFTRNFTIYDADDSKRALKRILKDLEVDTKRFPPGLFSARISRAKNELADPEDAGAAKAGPLGSLIGEVAREYQRRLIAANAMDFDDLLVNCYRLFDEHPAVLESYQDRFEYLHVDEYQDTNHVQYRLVSLLARKHRNLMVVGDDDQSIYGWRGADIRNILDFEKEFPDAVVVRLEENYRSTRAILEVANSVVSNNPDRRPKQLFTRREDGQPVTCYSALDEHDEARFVASETERLLREGYSYRDVAVFYRTHAQSRVIEDVFLRTGTPYRIVGGTKFFERAEVRDLLAYLRVLVNPADDESVLRILNTPRRGIGAATVQAVSEIARQDGLRFLDALAVACESGALATRAASCVEEFLGLIGEMRVLDRPTLKETVEAVIELSGLVSALEAVDTAESRGRAENVREMLSVVEDFDESHPGADLDEFMTWVSLRTDVDEMDEDERAVTLMTLHNAKGLEFPVVFIVGLEQGIFPHANSLLDVGSYQEERRLCYVGVTRAQERLYLTHAQRRELYGQRQHNPASDFLDEMPKEEMRIIVARPRGGFGRTAAERAARGRREWGAASGRLGGRPPGTGTAASGMVADDAEPEGRVFGAGRPEGDEAARFETGDFVEHKTFGAGRVVAVDGDKIVVDFDEAGLKDLLLGYAPIRKV